VQGTIESASRINTSTRRNNGKRMMKTKNALTGEHFRMETAAINAENFFEFDLSAKTDILTRAVRNNKS